MIYDLSPPITDRLAVWPGDTPPRREVLMTIEGGASVTLSTLHATVHLGSHADGPNHYGANAPGIGERDLGLYLGLCQVMGANVKPGGLVRADDLAAKIRAPRVLIRTGTFPDPGHFREDFAAIDPGLVHHFHGLGVRLVGIDTPSVDPYASRTLDAHRAFLDRDMAILEGLILDGVPDGLYELIALPLRLMGYDASPVRAVLRTLDHPSERPGT